MSSTPTGARSQFYKACTDPAMGYTEHYHPSHHNPGWCDQMESEFRAQLSEQGYVHEIEAEFGTEELGIFPKDKVDEALTYSNYIYNDLTYLQRKRIEDGIECGTLLEINAYPISYMYSESNPAPFNPLRTMAVDWDKYGADSSILILEWNIEMQKFMVLKRVSVPRGDYTFDNAVKLIIKYNKIYNPSWIYVDSGSGEYQYERLLLHGEENPETGLKTKVKRCAFGSSLDIQNPITGEIDKKPFKQFMIEQLVIAFERGSIALSPYDDIIHKQLIDYKVLKQNKIKGTVSYTDVDEHFVDCLAMAHLAFVLEFPEIGNIIKERVTSSETKITHKHMGGGSRNILEAIDRNPWDLKPKSFNGRRPQDLDDHPDDCPPTGFVYSGPPTNTKLMNSRSRNSGWGSRADVKGYGGGLRSTW